MNPEKSGPEKRLIRWLLMATIALLLLVLGLQLWQIFGKRPGNAYAGQPSAGSQSAAVPRGKAAMIEDVRSLNAGLSADALAALSAEELEQLYEAGAPGLPIGISAAARAAEAYAGTLEMDSITWDADPRLDESPAHYEVELHHISLGDFAYRVDAYTGEVLEGRAGLFQNIPPTEASGSAPDPDAAQNDSGFIDEEAARAAALAHAGVSGESAEDLRLELVWEDGAQIYMIEFRSGGRAYKYEIEAAGGAVRKAEQEWNGGDQGTRGFIGEEAARAAALAHAGLSEEDVGQVRWRLEMDDGVWSYKLEFLSGEAEYEYRIDAATGAVLTAGQDR